jgi:class 3 adenylate cyclase
VTTSSADSNPAAAAIFDSFTRYRTAGHGPTVFTEEGKALARSEMAKSMDRPDSLLMSKVAASLGHHFAAQQKIRELYGKPGVRSPTFGTPPGLEHLRGTDQQAFCATTTMFMDMVGSTRLAYLRRQDPGFVRDVKNAFICAAIDTITAFDGHVHRIMGDAVLAFFMPSDSSPPESGIVDGLNCAALLRLVADRVSAKLAQEGYGSGFSIRIGLDHGAQEFVMWSAYGYPNVEEVTATSFYVDVAAKLQQSAGPGEIMIGQTLIETVDLADDVMSIKTLGDGDSHRELPFVLPDLADADGVPASYQQRRLEWEAYLGSGPNAQTDTGAVTALTVLTPGALHVSVTEHATERGKYLSTYRPTSRHVRKGRWLRFKPTIPSSIQFPAEARFTVRNHGQDARKAKDLVQQPSVIPLLTPEDAARCEHWRHVAYRGFHYMNVEIVSAGRVTLKSRLGVYGM